MKSIKNEHEGIQLEQHYTNGNASLGYMLNYLSRQHVKSVAKQAH